jgi:hypothetical protein
MQSGEAACTSAGPEIEELMSRYQQADAGAAAALVATVSPQLYRVYQRLRDLFQQSQFPQPAHKGVAK